MLAKLRGCIYNDTFRNHYPFASSSSSSRKKRNKNVKCHTIKMRMSILRIRITYMHNGTEYSNFSLIHAPEWNPICEWPFCRFAWFDSRYLLIFSLSCALGNAFALLASLPLYNVHIPFACSNKVTTIVQIYQQICLTNNSNNVNKSGPHWFWSDFLSIYTRNIDRRGLRLTTHKDAIAVYIRLCTAHHCTPRNIAKWSSHWVCVYNTKIHKIK